MVAHQTLINKYVPPSIQNVYNKTRSVGKQQETGSTPAEHLRSGLTKHRIKTVIWRNSKHGYSNVQLLQPFHRNTIPIPMNIKTWNKKDIYLTPVHSTLHNSDLICSLPFWKNTVRFKWIISGITEKFGQRKGQNDRERDGRKVISPFGFTNR